MRKFAATFKLTYFKKLKARSFIVSTIIMMLIITGAANFDKIIKLFDGGSENVAIVTQDNTLYQQVKGQLTVINKDVHYEKLSEDEAKKQIKQEEIDQAYVIHEDKQHALTGTILSTSSPSDNDKGTLQAVLTQLQTQKIAQDLGLQGNDLQRLQSQSQIDNTIIQKSGQENSSASEDEQDFAKIITMLGTFLMFFIVFNYAQQIATEVATEKTSRVSEMIITSVKPTTHIMAKIAGVLALAFTQIVILALTFVANYIIFDLQSMFGSVNLSLTPHLTRLIVFGVIFLILGILSFVILAAILGNLTARIEDLAQSLMPMTFLIMAAFYAGYFGSFNPDNVFINIMSYVPFFSPFVTFSRLALTTTPTFEAIIAVIIHIVLIGVLLFLAAKSYKNAVLSFEKGWKNVLKRAFQREE
ncbi:ABC transporter permease [Staphylococcus delphini]|uniref:Sodium ABC transporter permease n=1 Tax=Staphylococcus delphini TaxID=53344 RepID=A0A2A4GZB5_9STAP|nr:ABC transporter permease [Staphylococcus delphini]PCF56494.1 sodium ABC transporter permease [Staphylococcus delphini]PCF63408.1 sodium ABC transporter permease [Staphylococcus delphini]PCF73428.1 sodium ABC transporter permease [Staphylococcus delphini]UXS22183.1 ABC transporter permease [Staphylococcus delphini]UXS58124.1 ABC transporter permease [Staphylococcus delphini]